MSELLRWEPLEEEVRVGWRDYVDAHWMTAVGMVSFFGFATLPISAGLDNYVTFFAFMISVLSFLMAVSLGISLPLGSSRERALQRSFGSDFVYCKIVILSKAEEVVSDHCALKFYPDKIDVVCLDRMAIICSDTFRIARVGIAAAMDDSPQSRKRRLSRLVFEIGDDKVFFHADDLGRMVEKAKVTPWVKLVQNPLELG